MDMKISVLIVDDEQHIRDFFECHPALDTFEVFVAADGKEGLELARSVRPDVILLDWMLPDMDGMAVLAQLKNDPDTKNIPVYMLTAKKTPSDVGQAICEGVDGYFVKPFNISKLVETLKRKLASPVSR